MTDETATALSDFVLSGGTFLLALTVKSKRAQKTWQALLGALALASALGAIYHGPVRFHTGEFWVLVSASSVASGFLFLAVCGCITKPDWKWVGWLWPLCALAGVLVGAMISRYPFYFISIINSICILVGAMILRDAPIPKARSWIYMGILCTFVGFLAQRFTTGTGFFNHNALFHWFQLGANFMFWRGAKHT